MNAQLQPQPLPAFTARELEVLHLQGAGWQAKVIAHQLGISERTVEIHVGRIRDKIGLTGRTQIAMGIWYALNFPERVGISRAPTAMERDASRLLDVVRRMMQGEVAARQMARVLLERHADHLGVRVAVEGDL